MEGTYCMPVCVLVWVCTCVRARARVHTNAGAWSRSSVDSGLCFRGQRIVRLCLCLCRPRCPAWSRGSALSRAVGCLLPSDQYTILLPRLPSTWRGSNAALAFLPAAPMGLRASSTAQVARHGRAPLALRMQQATVDREQDVGVGQASMRKDAESLMQPCPETK